MYKEHCLTVYDRRGNMKPVEALRGQQGYTTVFGFSEQDAEIIKSSGNSRGLQQYNVGSSCLIMDFDDGEKSAISVSETLQERDITHWVFESGGKGMHIYAQCETGYSQSLPYQHAKLAASLSDACDPSLYRHNSLIRLPGTIHERTGKPKTLRSSFSGVASLQLPPVPVYFPEPMPVTNRDNLYFMFAQMASFLDGDVTPGHRHDCIWRLTNDCYRAGLSFDATLELAQTINEQFKPPKDSLDVARVVEERYRCQLSTHSL